MVINIAVSSGRYQEDGSAGAISIFQKKRAVVVIEAGWGGLAGGGLTEEPRQMKQKIREKREEL